MNLFSVQVTAGMPLPKEYIEEVMHDRSQPKSVNLQLLKFTQTTQHYSYLSEQQLCYLMLSTISTLNTCGDSVD